MSNNPLGRVDEAIKWFSEAARRDPARTRGFVDRFATYYLQLGDYEKAHEFYAHAALGGGEPMEDAIALLYLDRRADAIEFLETIREKEEVPWRLQEILRTLAALDLQTGDVDMAVHRYAGFWGRCRESQMPVPDCPVELLRIAQLTGHEDELRPFFEDLYRDWVVPWVELPQGPGMQVGMWRTRFLTLFGRHDEALDALEATSLADRLWDSGWAWQFLRDYDPALDGIRDHPRFQAAFAEVEAEMARQLEHVRQMEQDGEVLTIEALQALQN